ncbi:tRNA pseudouridine(55) synthase TruB [Halalkalibacterium halodurans]|nr:tRNA pseudouridine(55) synthase TruB [Halalkalibacterium halodurans]MDY7222958.1 tRNA pseudouridine(55) synthase TruB [Halalkalibacterium halodurans]MDY7242179.1 tRNA pseudouridine(55) synthase TruB [Halalkalibacterium halodurans]MED4080075.1 tRNA pseudouridine(55) synthase TruB [Halalkalibacterium halodurans]MED4086842.1 tRNA pseudouridine(55) synthase TruB [Halalkalibacterium halodurans]MED4104246.1 tRNA pseudouridine(55) synthase TruB [Halalkalibacterium halodurans]
MDMTGILPLAKPRGMTSHDCVAKLRRLLKTKKVGHTGTLDPDVYGVLPVCIGHATKVAQYMSDYPKAYEGEVTIGFSTTTEDRSGDTVETKTIQQPFVEAVVDQVLATFVGEIKQIPPMYSAVKVRGKRLYEYARAGITVERPERTVTIFSLERMSDIVYEEGVCRFRFNVSCSKGTYVRTLAVDIGKALGYPAHMSDLVRTKSGPFSLEECFTFTELEERLEQGEGSSLLLPIETAISDIPRVQVNKEIEEKIRHGAVLPQKWFNHPRFTVYNEEGALLAIYKAHPSKDGFVKPEKMLANDQQ